MNLTEVYEAEFCIQSSSSSCVRTALLTTVDVFLYLSAAAAVLLTVCGNLLVIISICHFKQLHTPTNLLLLSLALSDILVGVIVMPFQFTLLIESCWLFGTTFCSILNLFSLYLTCVSIYNVTFIAVDRFIALFDPFHYSNRVTVRVTLLVICFIWILSIFYTMALLYFNGNMLEQKTCPIVCPVSISLIWATVDLIVGFIVPCLTMILLYVHIFALAKKHAESIKCVGKQQFKNARKGNSMASEWKAAKLLGIIVSVFLMCLVPYNIGLLATANVEKTATSGHLIPNFLACLIFLNSTMNPIIYALFYPWFQKCVKLIIRLKIFSSGSSQINVF
ncbi:trace amine-associated receptor 13c-like [Megalops cyprinoides]|uniref:trace amine-associated receptor 13c-like n=1 Tax=Megalops cyprinoides TaxID=118141 RepID=UPI00186539CB|nr:trace amine-associated receptor 13c-like [Megalops cyprinoides]